MSNKHFKKCSTSLATGEMQIKNTLKSYFTPARIAIKKLNKTKQILVRIRAKENPYSHWWKCKLVQLL